MKTENVLWLLIGMVSAVIIASLINDFSEKSNDEPIHSETISYDYHWLPGDSSHALTIVTPKREVQIRNQNLREYEITAQNEAFTVKLSVLGREVESACILEASFHGQAQVTVYRDRIVSSPQTPGMTVTYRPQADFHAPREKWAEAEILMGAHLLPPYSPIIAVGFGLRRLPLIGKLPPVMIGAGWFGQGVGGYIAYRF